MPGPDGCVERIPAILDSFPPKTRRDHAHSREKKPAATSFPTAAGGRRALFQRDADGSAIPRGSQLRTAATGRSWRSRLALRIQVFFSTLKQGVNGRDERGLTIWSSTEAARKIKVDSPRIIELYPLHPFPSRASRERFGMWEGSGGAVIVGVTSLCRAWPKT